MAAPRMVSALMKARLSGSLILLALLPALMLLPHEVDAMIYDVLQQYPEVAALYDGFNETGLSLGGYVVAGTGPRSGALAAGGC